MYLQESDKKLKSCLEVFYKRKSVIAILAKIENYSVNIHDFSYFPNRQRISPPIAYSTSFKCKHFAISGT